MKFAFIAILLWVFACAARADLVGRHAGAHQLLMSGDGTIAFTSGAGSVRVWNVATKRLIAQLAKRIELAAVSDDGARFCAIEGYESDGERQTEIKLWRVAGGQIGATGKRLVPHGRKLMAAHWQGGQLWIVTSASVITRLDERARSLGAVELMWNGSALSNFVAAFSPDGRFLAVDGNARGGFAWQIFDAQSGRHLRASAPYHGTAFQVAFSNDGAILGALTQVFLPDLRGPEDAWEFRDSMSGVRLPDQPETRLIGQYPVAVANGAVWCIGNEMRDARTGKLSAFQLPSAWRARQLRALRFARDGKTMVALDENGDIWAEQTR